MNELINSFPEFFLQLVPLIAFEFNLQIIYLRYHMQIERDFLAGAALSRYNTSMEDHNLFSANSTMTERMLTVTSMSNKLTIYRVRMHVEVVERSKYV
jgi:hypothetical protein